MIHTLLKPIFLLACALLPSLALALASDRDQPISIEADSAYIDDVNGVTLASASTMDKDAKIKAGGNVAAASEVGKLVAERAKKAGVSEVVFDRGSYIYHGRIKALADAAREGGLSF